MEAPLETNASHPETAEPASRRIFVFVAALAIIVFVLVQALMQARSSSPEHRVRALMQQIQAEIIDAPLTPAQAAWPLETSDGTYTLSSLPRDTIIFLNFWATWCPPCREELPSMLRLRDAMRDHRFAMVAVSYDETWDDITAFFSRWIGHTPPPQQLFVVRDPKTEPGESLRETFGTTSMPDTYVVMNGRVLARFVNARNWVDRPIVDYFKALSPPL
jgi:thiol-disulfide isomerase/thioredoxin